MKTYNKRKEHGIERKNKKSKWEKRIAYATQNVVAAFQMLVQRVSESVAPALEHAAEVLHEILQNGLEETE